MALEEAKTAEAGLDPDFEPLAWSRLESLRGAALVQLGELDGETQPTSPTGSRPWPPPWSRSPPTTARWTGRAAQAALGAGLQAMGEATTSERCFERAVTCYDRASHILKTQPAWPCAPWSPTTAPSAWPAAPS